MTWLARIRVMPRSGLLDPQGSAVEHALAALGFKGVGAVRIGRMIDVNLDAASEADARRSIEEMCTRLIANPVIEDHTIVSIEEVK